MPKSYLTPIEVRGYELDSFGHVNHANYLNYLEFARWRMLAAEGVTLEKFREWKRFPVIASVEIQYLRPTFMGDALEVETQLIEYRRSSMIISQVIRKDGKTVVQAKVRSVVVDLEGKPTPLPDEMERKWKALVESDASSSTSEESTK